MSKLKLVFLLATATAFAYLAALVVEYEYMEYRYDRTVGHIADIRQDLRHFSETVSHLDELGAGYVSNDISEEEHASEFTVYRYQFFLGGYFHVIYDESEEMWDKAPTGFTDFF